MWWEDNIQSEMLDQEAICRLLPYMTKAYAEDKRSADGKHDPITATVIIFLTCPLQLGLTEVGAMLFQGHASLVFPFNLMSERQKAFLRACLERRTEWSVLNESVVFRRARGEPGRCLQPSEVLLSLCRKLLEGQAAAQQRLAVCNIILQRVQGYVPIDKPVQRQLNEWLASNAAYKSQNGQGAEQNKAEHEQASSGGTQAGGARASEEGPAGAPRRPRQEPGGDGAPA